jgi:hypothetical protein
MKLSWLFNGSMEAHHLLAAYAVVWTVQGGYALWVAYQWRALRRPNPNAPAATPDQHL